MTDRRDLNPARSIAERVAERRAQHGRSRVGKVAAAANVRILPPTPLSPEQTRKLDTLSRLVEETMDILVRRDVPTDTFTLGEMTRRAWLFGAAKYPRIPIWTIRYGTIASPPIYESVQASQSTYQPEPRAQYIIEGGIGMGTEGTLYKTYCTHDVPHLGGPVLVKASKLTDKQLLANPYTYDSPHGGSEMQDAGEWEQQWGNVLADGVLLQTE